METVMQSSTMTIKGQVTIPANIRRQFKLQAGMKISFDIEDEKIILQPVPDKVENGFGLVAGTRSVSLDDMEKIIENQACR